MENCGKNNEELRNKVLFRLGRLVRAKHSGGRRGGPDASIISQFIDFVALPLVSNSVPPPLVFRVLKLLLEKIQSELASLDSTKSTKSPRSDPLEVLCAKPSSDNVEKQSRGPYKLLIGLIVIFPYAWSRRVSQRGNSFLIY